MVDGRQYVSVLVGYGGQAVVTVNFNDTYWDYRLPRRLLTFALDGTAELDTSTVDVPDILDEKTLVIEEEAEARGAILYSKKMCLMCHGRGTRSVGAQGPDLRRSAIALSPATLGEFLRSGASAEYGMPAYPELSDDEVNSLYIFIRAGAREALGKRDFVPKPANTSG
jgi:quinohemoprotein ethanol dehydrogenase